MVIVAITLITLFQPSLAYKILVYNPQIGHSHVSFMNQIADTLAEAGHDVVRINFLAFKDNCMKHSVVNLNSISASILTSD